MSPGSFPFSFPAPNGFLMASQSKTGVPVAMRLSNACRDALDALSKYADLGPDPLILPHPGARCQFEHWLRTLVDLAGVRPGRTRWIRRAAASYVERDHPGMAGRFLGHLTPPEL